MNLRVSGRFAKFLCRISERLFVGWAVVEELAVSGNDRNHIPCIFRDEAKELFALNKPHSKAMNLKLLINHVDDEEQNHRDQSACRQVDARRVQKIKLESVNRARKRNDADREEQRNDDSGEGEPPLPPFRDVKIRSD